MKNNSVYACEHFTSILRATFSFLIMNTCDTFLFKDFLACVKIQENVTKEEAKQILAFLELKKIVRNYYRNEYQCIMKHENECASFIHKDITFYECSFEYEKLNAESFYNFDEKLDYVLIVKCSKILSDKLESIEDNEHYSAVEAALMLLFQEEVSLAAINEALVDLYSCNTYEVAKVVKYLEKMTK